MFPSEQHNVLTIMMEWADVTITCTYVYILRISSRRISFKFGPSSMQLWFLWGTFNPEDVWGAVVVCLFVFKLMFLSYFLSGLMLSCFRDPPLVWEITHHGNGSRLAVVTMEIRGQLSRSWFSSAPKSKAAWFLWGWTLWLQSSSTFFILLFFCISW